MRLEARFIGLASLTARGIVVPFPLHLAIIGLHLLPAESQAGRQECQLALVTPILPHGLLNWRRAKTSDFELPNIQDRLDGLLVSLEFLVVNFADTFKSKYDCSHHKKSLHLNPEA